MTEIRSLIADVDIAVVDPDLLWRVGHMNLLRGAVVRDFAAPEEALGALTAGRPAVLVLGPAAEDVQVDLVVQARRERPELRTARCLTAPHVPDGGERAADDAEADDIEGEAADDAGVDAGVDVADIGADAVIDVDVVPEDAAGARPGPETVGETATATTPDAPLVTEAAGFDLTLVDDGDEAAFVAGVEALLEAARALAEPEPSPDDRDDLDDRDDRDDEGREHDHDIRDDQDADAGGRGSAGPAAGAAAGGGGAAARADGGSAADRTASGASRPRGAARRSARDLRPAPGLALPPRLAVITSAKGGEGASTVAVNLAHELASRAGVRTAVVDGDPYFGDVTMELGAVPAKVPVATELPLTDALLEELVAFPATEGEPIVIRSPFPGEDAAAAGPEVLRTMLAVAAKVADVVIADVPLELLLAAPWIDQVAVVVLVSTPRTASLKNALVAAQRLSGTTNVGLVVNTIQHHQRSASAEEISRALGLPLFGHLPSDGTLRRATTKAHPREIAEPHSHYRHAMTAVRRAVASHFPVLV